jgi:hypothetical protein
MSQSIVEEHKKFKIPSIVWETLQKRYAPKTTVSRITAGCDFANARMNLDSESVPDYLARLQRLRDRFAECGGTIDEAMYKGNMFEGLPDDFKVLEGNVKFTSDDVAAEEVKDHILEHYRLLQQRMNAAPSGTSNVKAYHTQYLPNSGKSSNNGNGGGYGKKVKSGGISKRGKGKGKGSRSKDHPNQDDICYYCKEEGHWKKGCLKHLWLKTQKKSKDNDDKGSGPSGPSSASGENSSTAVVNYNWKPVGQCSRSFAAVAYFAAKLQAKSFVL